MKANGFLNHDEMLGDRQRLQLLTASSLSDIILSNEDYIQDATKGALINALLVHCGGHEPDPLRSACIRCLAILTHKNKNVQKVISGKSAAINTFVALSWHKDPSISVHALQIVGNAALPFKEKWNKADPMNASIGVFQLEMAKSSYRTERLAATLHAIARISLNNVKAQNLLAQKKCIKEFATIYKPHVKEPPDIVIGMLAYCLVGITSTPAISNEISYSGLVKMMIDAFMTADVDTSLPMSVIARPPGGYGEAKIVDKDIICLYHRKNVLENYADNLSKALAQTCSCRPATKTKALSVINKIKDTTKVKRTWIRAHLLMTIIENYEPPKTAWKEQRKASARKVGIPNQSRRKPKETPIEPFKYEEEEKSGLCGCFSSSKKKRGVDDDVTAKDLELLHQARNKKKNKYKVQSPEKSMKKGELKKIPTSSAKKRKGSKKGEALKVEDLDDITIEIRKKREMKRKRTKSNIKDKGGQKAKSGKSEAEEKRNKEVDNEEDINNSKGNSKKKFNKKKAKPSKINVKTSQESPAGKQKGAKSNQSPKKSPKGSPKRSPKKGKVSPK
eukprot:g12841.t1